MEDTLTKTLKEILDEVRNLGLRVGVIESNLEQVKQTQKQAGQTIKHISSQNLKIGYIYESMCRQQLRQKRGELFARSYHAVNLTGLARVCLPKDATFNDVVADGSVEAVSVANQNDCFERRLELLVDAALEKLPTFAQYYRRADPKTKHFQKVKHQLDKFDALRNPTDSATDRETLCRSDSPKEQIRFLRNSPLGLWAFSLCCVREGECDKFISEVEMDVRGEIRLSRFGVDVTVGEVKSGDGRHTAVLQLLERLAILHAAAKVTIGALGSSTAFRLIGEVFAPRAWKPVTEIELTRIKEERGLTLDMSLVHIVVTQLSGL